MPRRSSTSSISNPRRIIRSVSRTFTIGSRSGVYTNSVRRVLMGCIVLRVLMFPGGLADLLLTAFLLITLAIQGGLGVRLDEECQKDEGLEPGDVGIEPVVDG